MKVSNVVLDALQLAGVFAGFGVVVGTASGLWNEYGRVAEQKKMHLRLPPVVCNYGDLKDAIVVLSDGRHSDLGKLESIARRFEKLISLAASVENAQPKTVKPSISSVASEIEASILRNLGLFYHASHIPVTEATYKRMKVHVPMTRDFKFAHDAMMQLAESLVDGIHHSVKDKLERAF